jgi:hypothetical protein
MNRDLFLSILAIDSYNRGYDVGVVSIQSVRQDVHCNRQFDVANDQDKDVACVA